MLDSFEQEKNNKHNDPKQSSPESAIMLQLINTKKMTLSRR